MDFPRMNFEDMLRYQERQSANWWSSAPPGYTSPMAKSTVKTRRIPMTGWLFSESEPELRLRMLSVDFRGEDVIDTSKPWTESVETVEGVLMIVVRQ